MKRGLIILGAALASLAFGTPDQMKAFWTAERLAESSRLRSAECGVCHTEPPIHNDFGKDVAALLRARRLGVIDMDILREIGQKDSDRDGWSNAVEIRGDTLPGDPLSHPKGNPSSSAPTDSLRWMDRFTPKHSFHPVLVHFPIALFLFGAVLDIAGLRRRDSGMRRAGWLCLLFGAVSSLFAALTGLLAFLRGGFMWQGTALTHVVLALSATVAMAAVVLWRRKSEHNSMSYITALLVASGLVGTAGHFGGVLVYGP